MENLHRQGFSSFCPRYRRELRHARRIKIVLAPLFPGYVFVSLNTQLHAWRSINGTIGVKRLICLSSSLPRPMPDDAMERIFERCENGVLKISKPALMPGDVVRFVSGPFADQLAVIDQLDDKGRVRLLFDILGQEAVVSVETSQIAPHTA